MQLILKFYCSTIVTQMPDCTAQMPTCCWCQLARHGPDHRMVVRGPPLSHGGASKGFPSLWLTRCTQTAGVKWFEVDRADVLAAKRTAMTAAGATFEPKGGNFRQFLAASAPLTDRLISQCTAVAACRMRHCPQPVTLTRCGRSQPHSGEALEVETQHMCGAGAAAEDAKSPVQYSLRASSYASLAADLRERGWTKDLEAQGFDPTTPTVWLAEVAPLRGFKSFVLHRTLLHVWRRLCCRLLNMRTAADCRESIGLVLDCCRGC